METDSIVCDLGSLVGVLRSISSRMRGLAIVPIMDFVRVWADGDVMYFHVDRGGRSAVLSLSIFGGVMGGSYLVEPMSLLRYLSACGDGECRLVFGEDLRVEMGDRRVTFSLGGDAADFPVLEDESLPFADLYLPGDVVSRLQAHLPYGSLNRDKMLRVWSQYAHFGGGCVYSCDGQNMCVMEDDVYAVDSWLSVGLADIMSWRGSVKLWDLGSVLRVERLGVVDYIRKEEMSCPDFASITNIPDGVCVSLDAEELRGLVARVSSVGSVAKYSFGDGISVECVGDIGRISESLGGGGGDLDVSMNNGSFGSILRGCEGTVDIHVSAANKPIFFVCDGVKYMTTPCLQ